MKGKIIVRRLKGLLRWKKRENSVEQFMKVLRAIEKMEDDGMLAVCSDEGKPGIVLSGELGNYFNMCYLIRMQHYAKVWGMERFFEARQRLKNFGKTHNPDEELLNLCRNARLVINFRRAAAVDGHVKSESELDTIGYSELKENEPLFITYMNEILTEPTHVGYEVNGEITLEEYATKKNNAV